MEHLVGERLVEVGGVLLVVVGRVEVDHATRGGTATALPAAVLRLRIGQHVLATDLDVRRIDHDAEGEEQRVTDSSRYLAAVVLRLSQIRPGRWRRRRTSSAPHEAKAECGRCRHNSQGAAEDVKDAR